jgi:ABC-type antimicrobial peptide transport system permease subunit
LPLATAVEHEVHALDRNLPVFDVKTQEMQVDEMLDRERLIAVLSALFGGLAILLAAIGLYGVMAYSVACRAREMGIRMVVGASAGDITALVLRETAAITTAGICIGLSVAFVLARLVQSLLYDMRADDVRILLCLSAVLLVVGVAAGLWPARRAARMEPVSAFRTE